jgi:hypothetical protein
MLEDNQVPDEREEIERFIAVITDFFFEGNKLGSTDEYFRAYDDAFLKKSIEDLASADRFGKQKDDD